MCGGFISSYQPITQLSRCQLGVLQLSPILTWTTWSVCRPRRMRDQFHDTPPTSDTSHKAQIVTCAFDWWAVNLVAPMTPSFLRFNNLLGWNSWNSGKHFVYYCYWFVIKDTMQETANWKRCLGQVWREGLRAATPLQEWYPPSVCKRSSNPEFPEPCRVGVFMKVSLHRHTWLNHWPLAIENLQLVSLPLHWSSGIWLKVPTLSSCLGLSRNQLLCWSYLEEGSKFVSEQKTLLSLRKFQGV